MLVTSTARHDRRETKRAPLPLSDVSATGVFEGYASLFDTADLGRDVVAPGAFADSLRRRGPGGVKMLWQHDAAQPIGTWLSIAEDARGLKVRGRLNLAVARAREVLALMREGAVDGLSIGFRTRKAVTDRTTGLRRLQSIDLWEISVVTFPMHPGARVTAVKRTTMPPPQHTPLFGPAALDAIRRDITALRWRKDALVLEHAFGKAAALERRYAADQPRDNNGRWTGGEGSSSLSDRYGEGDTVTARIDDDDCETQYELDNAICRKLRTSFQREKCWASSMDRYSACLKGRPILPLRY